MSDLPHITVATVVSLEDKFLMVREGDGDDKDRLVYNQPAGHLEAGETLVEAARRETLEETGWYVDVTSLLGIYQYFAVNNGVTYIRHCFIAKPLEEDKAAIIDSDIESVHWLTESEIKGLQAELRSPIVWRAIEDFRSGKSYPLDLIKL